MRRLQHVSPSPVREEYLHHSQWHQEFIPALQTCFSLVYIPSLVPHNGTDCQEWTWLRCWPSLPSLCSHLSVCDTHLSLSVHRYLFALQVKQDLAQGRLTCNDTSAALLISHIVQCKFCWLPLEIMLEVTQWSNRLERKSHPLKTIIMFLMFFCCQRECYG